MTKTTTKEHNQHRVNCCGEEYPLLMLMEMAESAGVKFTKKERRLFI